MNNAAREAAYSAGSDLGDQVAIRAQAEREANVQGQGGEGALEVSLPSCATPQSPPGCESYLPETGRRGLRLLEPATR